MKKFVEVYRAHASIHARAGKLNIGFGWFSGDPFKLVSVELCEFSDGFVQIVSVQIAKLALTISWY